MTQQTIKAWLASHYSEQELRERVGASRQNWAQRRPKLRKVAGLEILPGTWVYEREATDAYLAESAKHRPGNK